MNGTILAALIVIGIVAACGLLLKFVLPLIMKNSSWEISWREFIAGMLISGLVTTGVFAAGIALSTADLLQHEQFENGVETQAIVEQDVCEPGHAGNSAASGHSNCRYEYQNGETYTYVESYTVPVQKCSVGADGKLKCTTVLETRYRDATGYIYNPYSKYEYSFSIADSLGGLYQFPFPYIKPGESFKDYKIPDDVPRGQPVEWVESQTLLNAGTPRGVTRLVGYDNYFLANHDGSYGKFKKDVQQYLKDEILPVHTANIKDDPLYGFNGAFADKVSFVGLKGANETAWQNALTSFNGALGAKYGGDLHLVFIDASLVDDPVRYLNALKAYWLSDDFDRRAIGADAIIVVAGVQNNTIEWSLASTGMPTGNEAMLASINSSLSNVAFTPEAVLGSPQTTIVAATGAVRIDLGDHPGVLGKVILRETPYEEPCLSCYDKNDILPKDWQWSVMIIIVSVVSLIFWFIAGNVELLVFRRKSIY